MTTMDARKKERLVWLGAGFTLMVLEVIRYALKNPGSAYIETEEMRQKGGKETLESLLKRNLTSKEAEDLSTVMDVAAIKNRGLAGLFDLDRRDRAKRSMLT